MIEAPTREIAIGRKISALANFSYLDRSTSTAYTSPINVDSVGTRATQSAVLRSTLSCSVSVKTVW
jgi:hypothetical protein